MILLLLLDNISVSPEPIENCLFNNFYGIYKHHFGWSISLQIFYETQMVPHKHFVILYL